ncbi:lipid A biosynthesis lauroyl acyltransferase [Aliidiomarina shirensis]|uniref:Lipid A biosynthesis acyltransferase n=1 Tax=Aliidiomarina shirensis TaxID=1048642 RepID=A0A432WKT8_9GAMM|nr:LpxL/LpxP family Kdo(2)-lipid IV(A) lauroyl/palmitoleoyl acyltransferase [Aliidiomarina shirensis]RUO34368.1 lipid A biosynthesis lauroyl acyltransferase [Aliidiomarina shirensis]
MTKPTTDKTNAAEHSVELPRFRAYFLHPKFWGTWLMVGVLYLISWLPFRLQLWMGKGLGKLLFKLMPKRVKVARRNLELVFPERSAAEREQMLHENFANNGIALFETGMAWWWPNWRMKRKLAVEGTELLDQADAEGKGVFLVLFHFLSLEVHARMFGLVRPAVGLYRPHNNALMEYLQTKGRNRSNKYMIRKKDVRGMLNALNTGEVCGYLPDQDYGRNRSVYVPFFAVPDAATTTGTTIFAAGANCKTLITTIERLPGAKGYKLRIMPPQQPIPSGDETEDARRINKEVERAVNQCPEAYMWVHRRFKTRPDESMPSYYK